MKTAKTTVDPKVYDDAIKVETPEFPKDTKWKYEDADDELRTIAKYIKKISTYNDKIEEDRIKFLYTTNPKMNSGKYLMGDVGVRSDIDKMINNDFDYVIYVYYPIWKELSKEHKVIQLDKLLCKIDAEAMKKIAEDAKEFRCSMRHFGPETVLESSELVDLTGRRIADQQENIKKEAKAKKKEEAQYVNKDRAEEDNETIEKEEDVF